MTEPQGTSPGIPEEPASVAPEPAQAAEPVWVPENQPSWLRDGFDYLHGRLLELEKRIGG